MKNIKTLQRGVYKYCCIHIWGKWYRNPDTDKQFRVCGLCGESQVRPGWVKVYLQAKTEIEERENERRRTG